MEIINIKRILYLFFIMGNNNGMDGYKHFTNGLKDLNKSDAIKLNRINQQIEKFVGI